MVIAKEGKKIIYFLLVFNLLAVLLWASNVINYSILILMIGALLFCLNFFRDPKRIPPDGSNLIISPADGKVIRVEIIDDEKLGEVYAISIFLNIFNVHVNRMPLNGSILDIKYNEGKFLLAFNHKACDENERNTIELMTEKYKLFLSPLEKLKIMRKNSFNIEDVKLILDYDQKFKPGLYRLVKSFLESDFSEHCKLDEQILNFKYFSKIGNYKEH